MLLGPKLHRADVQAHFFGEGAEPDQPLAPNLYDVVSCHGDLHYFHNLIYIDRRRSSIFTDMRKITIETLNDSGRSLHLETFLNRGVSDVPPPIANGASSPL